MHASSVNCAELREYIRLIELVIDHGGDQEALSPADRAILRELHKVTTGEIERADLECDGRSSFGSPGIRCMRCAP